MKMSNSSLVTYRHITSHKTKGRGGHKIDKIFVHHMAANLSVKQCGSVFDNRQASAHYGVNGTAIGQYVDEADTAWHCGNFSMNQRSIGIELANDGGSSTNWHVADSTIHTAIKLIADICLRNGIQKINYTGDLNGNLCMHKWVVSTSCPGPYLATQFKKIADGVNAMIADIEPSEYRPTTPYTGTLPTASVKNGVKGEDTKACQTFLNWCINAGLKVDGNCGAKTVKAIKIFQKTYDLKADGSFGKKSREKAQEIIKEHEVYPYDGEYPNPNVTVTVEHPNSERVAEMAKALAWPDGTASSKYAYKGGSPTAAFKKALDKVFPKHSKWGKAASKGASCDVFAATVMNSTGIVTNMPRGYDEQKKYTNANLSKITRNNVKPLSIAKSGDMILYTKNASGSSRHVIILGNGVIYEAQYEKTYGHVNTSTSKINTSRPKVIIFRAKGTYKTTTTRSYLMRGDKGDEVKKLQQYINWFFRNKYGKDVLSVDGKFGANTQNYCKLMQSDLGFSDADGLVGPKTVEAMKSYKK